MRPIIFRLTAVALLAVSPPASARQADPAAPATGPQAAAQGQAPAALFQVVRAGDNGLSCEALIAEMLELNTRMQQMQAATTEQSMAISRNSMAAARRPGGSMGGAAMSLGGMAAAFVPGGALIMGAVSTAGALAAQARVEHQQQQMMASTEALSASMADLGPIAQRTSHLAEISRIKGC